MWNWSVDSSVNLWCKITRCNCFVVLLLDAIERTDRTAHLRLLSLPNQQNVPAQYHSECGGLPEEVDWQVCSLTLADYFPGCTGTTSGGLRRKCWVACHPGNMVHDCCFISAPSDPLMPTNTTHVLQIGRPLVFWNPRKIQNIRTKHKNLGNNLLPQLVWMVPKH